MDVEVPGINRSDSLQKLNIDEPKGSHAEVWRLWIFKSNIFNGDLWTDSDMFSNSGGFMSISAVLFFLQHMECYPRSYLEWRVFPLLIVVGFVWDLQRSLPLAVKSDADVGGRWLWQFLQKFLNFDCLVVLRCNQTIKWEMANLQRIRCTLARWILQLADWKRPSFTIIPTCSAKIQGHKAHSVSFIH